MNAALLLDEPHNKPMKLAVAYHFLGMLRLGKLAIEIDVLMNHVG